MITLEDNAVEPASRSELISPSPALLLAPGEPRAPIAILDDRRSRARRNADGDHKSSNWLSTIDGARELVCADIAL